MTVDDLTYPILCLTKYGPSPIRNRDVLCTAFVANYKSGYYESLVIIDSVGRTYRVSEATRAGWAGMLWGFSLLYSRRMKITLRLELATNQRSLDEVQRFVLQDMRTSHTWKSRDDFSQLLHSVSVAASFKELIGNLC